MRVVVVIVVVVGPYTSTNLILTYGTVLQDGPLGTSPLWTPREWSAWSRLCWTLLTSWPLSTTNSAATEVIAVLGSDVKDWLESWYQMFILFPSALGTMTIHYVDRRIFLSSSIYQMNDHCDCRIYILISDKRFTSYHTRFSKWKYHHDT